MTRDQSRTAGDDVREPHGLPSTTPSNTAARARKAGRPLTAEACEDENRSFPLGMGAPAGQLPRAALAGATAPRHVRPGSRSHCGARGASDPPVAGSSGSWAA